jgi:DNA-binding beta-propeller fold protein YncE
VAVNGQDRVAFVDTADGSVVATVPVPKPHTIAMQPDGRLAYVASQEPGHFALAVVDLAQRAVVRTLPLEKPPRDVEFANDGRALYFTLAGVNAVQVLNPATDSIETTIPTGVSPHVATNPPNNPYGMVVVQGSSELLLFDPATNRPVRAIAVGKQPHWATSSSDGRMAFVTNEGADSLMIITLSSGATRTITVGHAPRKVAVQPEPGLARVSIKGFQFRPETVTIRAGESVLWSNDDGAPHAIHLELEGNADHPLQPGEQVPRAFTQPGTYAYFCSFHNYMRGRVIVLGS